MSATATRHVKSSNSANILMCKQWWKVCWMYGDQEKYYRQLYGRRKMNNINTNFINFDLTDTKRPGAQITELTDDFLDNSTDIEPAPDEVRLKENKKEYFGAESEPIYGFDSKWQKDQRRQPIQQNYEEYINATDIDQILGSSINADSLRSMLQNGLPQKNQLLDSKEEIHKNGSVVGKTSKTVCRTKKGALVTEETEISTDGKTTANMKFQRSTVKTAPNRVKETLQPLKEDKVLDEYSRKKCVGDKLTTKTTTLVTVTQTSVTCCNE